MRGFFEVGVVYPKHKQNIGTLWRTASQLGASGMFTVGRPHKEQCSDTLKSWRHVPLRHYLNPENIVIPKSTLVVGVEQGGIPLRRFKHPERCIYLLGSEDNGLSELVMNSCHEIVSLESVATNSYNVALAGSIVLYHRVFGS